MRNRSLVLAAAAALVLPALLALDSVHAQDAPPEPQPVGSASIDMKQLRTDMEVMRRVLSKQAFKVAPASQGAAALYLHALGSSGSSNDSLYIAGDGVQLEFAVDYSLAQSDAAPPAATDETERSLWDEVLDDVEGRPRSVKGRVAGQLFDAAKVRRLEDAIVRVVGEYGARIRQLAPSDHITIVVRGAAPAPAASLVVADKDGRVETLVDDDGDPGAYAYRALGRLTGQRAHGSVLTMRFGVKNLQAFARGEFEPEDLRENTVINRY